MSIPTDMCLVGFVASTPSLEFGVSGTECSRSYVGVEHWRTKPDGSRTPLDPSFHPFVAYGTTAREIYEHFRNGDNIVAAGYILELEPEADEPNGPREVFVATDIGHNINKTDYAVNRPRHPAPQAAPRPAVRPPAVGR